MELPLAVPYIVTGIRVAAVTTVGLVTVAAIIGQGGLGRLILDGLRRTFWTPMTVGAVAVDPAGPHVRPRHLGRRPGPHAVDPDAGGRRSTMIVARGGWPRRACRSDIGLFEWLFDAQTWTGTAGILSSLADTIRLCAAVVVVATVLAVPLAAALAHVATGRAGGHRGSSTWAGPSPRSPSPGSSSPLAAVGLRVRAVADLHRPDPPRRAADLPDHLHGGERVDPVVVDAARGMGFGHRDVLLEGGAGPRPSAVILTGVRVAAVQVVATEPLRAFLGGNGLGRYVRDGLGQNNDSLVLGGAILVAALARSRELAFAALERLRHARGVRRLGAWQRSTIRGGP